MRDQLLGRIARYRVYLQQGLPIPDENGEDLQCLNFNYDYCVNKALEMETIEEIHEEENLAQISKHLKLDDDDVEGLLQDLEKTQFSGEIDFSGQNITDKTLIRLGALITQIPITGISLSENKISYIGGLEIGKALSRSKINKLIFHNCSLGISLNLIIENLQNITEADLGIIKNTQLRYLSKQEHQIQYLSLQEDLHEKWDTETKNLFLNNIPKSVLSVTFNLDNWEHKKFYGQVEIKCLENRKEYIKFKNNEFKSKDLNPNDPDYYDCDDFQANAFKFSVKSYLSNVFESLLDESLYYLEKERQNVLRDDEIYQVTKELVPKLIMEDICSADGSIIVLAKYLLTKIKK